MGSHPVNLAVRFVLEIAGLVALGLLGWQYGAGVYRYISAIGIPLLAAIFWGTFAIRNDPEYRSPTPKATGSNPVRDATTYNRSFMVTRQ